jgi:hypothetical protein
MLLLLLLLSQLFFFIVVFFVYIFVRRFFEGNTTFHLFFRFVLDILWLDNSLQAASEAEVADLNRAVIVDQDVCWLQIAVDNLTSMQIVQTA